MQSASCRCRLDLLAACCLQLLVCLASLASGQPMCVKLISSCQCQTESGKYIDLAPLARRDDYRFKRVAGPSGNWLYSYNPCFGFKCEGADNVAACQNDNSLSQEFALGTQNTAEFVYTQNIGLQLKYTSSHTSTTRVSLVQLVCSKSATTDEFLPLDDGEPSGAGEYKYSSSLTSRYACEVDSLANLLPGGMSVGDVLLIVFFAGAFAYLAGGFAVNVLALKKPPGPGALPNAAFWLGLSGYIRDGAAFCLGKLRQLFTMRRGGGGYESV